MGRPNPPFTGACLCGAVKITVATPPLLTFACHCHDCQKLSASAYTLSTMFAREGFSCSGTLITGGLGTPGRTHRCCKSCLNIIYSDLERAPHRVNLRTSVLDQANDFAPFIELMTGEKLPWASVGAVHSYTRIPETAEELQALMADYAGR